jgi:Flp pilus assembly protein TadG
MHSILVGQQLRKAKGINAIEVAISSFLIIALGALGANITLVLYGMSLNDTACRDAARAACQQSTSATALQAATSQLSIHATDGYWVTQPTITTSGFTYNDYASNNGTPPSSATIQSPYVSVTTQVFVRVPAPALFFGVQFSRQSTAANGGNGMIQFQRNYIFPIVKEKFYG